MTDKKVGKFDIRNFHQICFLYENCKDAAKEWAKVMGAGPALISRHIQIEKLTYKGKETTWDQDSALVQFGPLQVELMQTDDDSPAVHFKPGKNGRLHHVNWVVDDLDAETKRLEKLGFPLIWECTTAGDMLIRWFDAEKFLGCVFEVYQTNEVMEMGYSTVKINHERWDGKNPIANVYDMRTYEFVDEED